MKILIPAMTVLISSIGVFAADEEICGRYVVSEDAYEGKPANEFLGLPGTTRAWTKYYLKPQGKLQRRLLRSMKEGRDYCVTGTLFWCGEDEQHRCSTLKEIRSLSPENSITTN